MDLYFQGVSLVTSTFTLNRLYRDISVLIEHNMNFGCVRKWGGDGLDVHLCHFTKGPAAG